MGGGSGTLVAGHGFGDVRILTAQHVVDPDGPAPRRPRRQRPPRPADRRPRPRRRPARRGRDRRPQRPLARPALPRRDRRPRGPALRIHPRQAERATHGLAGSPRHAAPSPGFRGAAAFDAQGRITGVVVRILRLHDPKTLVVPPPASTLHPALTPEEHADALARPHGLFLDGLVSAVPVRGPEILAALGVDPAGSRPATHTRRDTLVLGLHDATFCAAARLSHRPLDGLDAFLDPERPWPTRADLLAAGAPPPLTPRAAGAPLPLRRLADPPAR